MKKLSRIRGFVGRSYDSATSAWLEVIRRYGDEIGHIVAKLEPNAFWLSPDLLKQAREETGLSQRNLAKAVGISSSVIANYEAGLKEVRWENVLKLYTVLEARGSASAAKALLSIALMDKEISLATLHLIEGDRVSTTAHVEECEAEEQRLRAKLGLTKDGPVKFKYS